MQSRNAKIVTLQINNDDDDDNNMCIYKAHDNLSSNGLPTLYK